MNALASGFATLAALCLSSPVALGILHEPSHARSQADDADASDEFGRVYEATRSCLVTVDTRGVETGGFLFEAHGRVWLAVPPSFGVAPEVEVRIALFGRTPSSSPSATLTSALASAPIDVGQPAAVRLYDMSAERDRIVAAGVRPPILADATGQHVRRLPGSLVGVLSWSTTKVVAIDLARVRSAELDKGSPLLLQLDRRLSSRCASMPIVDQRGCLVGVCGTSEGSPSGPNAGYTAYAISEAVHAELPQWANASAIEQFVALAEDEGLTRVARWRVARMDGGSLTFMYDPPMPVELDSSLLAAIPDVESSGIELSVTLGKCIAELDQAPPGDAARLGMKREAEGALCTVSVQPVVGSDAQVLIVDAVEDCPATQHLPLVQSLLQLASTRGIASDATQDRGEDSGDGPPDTGTVSFPTSNPDGPLVRIVLHGTVGLCVDPNDLSLEPCFTAHDFRAALRRAASLNPSKVVLDIESGGGRTDSMDGIMRMIQESTAQGAQFAAHVGDAGSAAGLIALTCPEIVVRPTARVGSAVTIMTDGSSAVSRRELLKDDPELLMKLESFDRAKIDGASHSAGRSPAIMRAMMDSTPGLWWSATTGFTDQSDPGSMVLDPGDSEVLTLTAKAITDTKLGRAALGDDELRAALGLPSDRQIIDVSREMRQSYRSFLESRDVWIASGLRPDSPEIEALRELYYRP